MLEGAGRGVLRLLTDDAMRAYGPLRVHASLLTARKGSPAKLARMNLPAHIYTSGTGRWTLQQPLSTSCACALTPTRNTRSGPMRDAILARWVKNGCQIGYAAFEDYRMGGAQISGKGARRAEADCLRGSCDAGDVWA